MSEMPERIWANSTRAWWYTNQGTEYVRADVAHQRLINHDALRQSVVDMADEIERLKKVADQAIALANIRLEYRTKHDDTEGDEHPYVYCDSCGTPFMYALGAYLKEKQS